MPYFKSNTRLSRVFTNIEQAGEFKNKARKKLNQPELTFQSNSYSTLKNTFKKYTGHSYHHYVEEIRMKKAVELITQG